MVILNTAEKLDESYIADRNAKWHRHSGDKYGSFSQNYTYVYYHTLGHLSQRNENLYSHKILYPSFYNGSLIIAPD